MTKLESATTCRKILPPPWSDRSAPKKYTLHGAEFFLFRSARDGSIAFIILRIPGTALCKSAFGYISYQRQCFILLLDNSQLLVHCAGACANNGVVVLPNATRAAGRD